jgi:hypothetical protein
LARWIESNVSPSSNFSPSCRRSSAGWARPPRTAGAASRAGGRHRAQHRRLSRRRFLEQVAEQWGYPKAITVDHGPEFVSNALDQWAHAHAVRLLVTLPDAPLEPIAHVRIKDFVRRWTVSPDDGRVVFETSQRVENVALSRARS